MCVTSPKVHLCQSTTGVHGQLVTEWHLVYESPEGPNSTWIIPVGRGRPKWHCDYVGRNSVSEDDEMLSVIQKLSDVLGTPVDQLAAQADMQQTISEVLILGSATSNVTEHHTDTIAAAAIGTDGGYA